MLAETQSILEEASTDEEDDFDNMEDDLMGESDSDVASAVGMQDGGPVQSVQRLQSDDLRELQSGLQHGASPAARSRSNPGSVASGKSSKQQRYEKQSKALAKAKATIRQYNNSSSFVCRSILCLLLPVTTVLMYAGALLLIQDDLSRSTSLSARRIVTAQALEAKTFLLSTRLQSLAGSVWELQ